MFAKLAAHWQGLRAVDARERTVDRTAMRWSARLGLHLVVACLLAVAAFAALPFATAHAAGNAIQTENQLPGDPTWNAFSAPSAYDTIAGYASQISVNHGGSLDLFVTTTDQSFDIKIYRTGWYSGAGANLKEDLGVFQGVHYPVPAPNPVTGMIACNWPKVTTLNIPANWVTGVYVAKLTTNANNSSFIYFVVRDDGGHEAIQVQTSVTTYQAYNIWGGLSLYSNALTNQNLYPYPHATKVSFDRPFSDGNGAGQYLFYEYPFVRWAEEQGYDLSYITNVDTATNVDPLTNHKAFLSLGHDEYWSMSMRQNVQNAIAAGVNVAFFSANTCYWQIRFEPSAGGVANRVEVGYKDFAEQSTAPGPDPQWNVNNAIVTSNWRDGVVNDPENTMIGVLFEDLDIPSTMPYVVSNASSWVFANTGFVNGSTVPGIVGYEYDVTNTAGAGPAPAGLTVLSKSPVTGQDGEHSYSNSTIYTAPSGARVFASGTIQWSWGLANTGSNTYANAGIQQATANILANFTGTTPPPPPNPLPSGTYLQDGFEAGNLNQWTMNSNSTGTLGPETAVVNSGSYAAEFTNAASGSYVTVSQNLAGGPEAQTYTRFYFNVNSTLAGNVATLATASDASGKNVWTIYYDGPRKGLDVYVQPQSGNATALYTNQNVIQPNTWNAVEIQSNESSSGGATVWLNGTQVLMTGTGNYAVANKYDTLTLWNDAIGTTYFDDVVVSNADNGLVKQNPTPNASLSTNALSFGSVYTGITSTALSATLTDTGTAALTIGAIGITGTNPGDFAQTNTCGASLAVGASCTISVTFTPSATGSRTANLNVSDNAASSPQSATLIGAGVIPPSGMVLGTVTDFGNQMVGTTSAAQAITLKNYDATTYSISGISLTGANPGDFAQTTTCGASLAPGASCTISITFAPTATGSRAATLSVADTGPASPQTAALSGTGTPQVPVAGVAPNNLNLGTQALTTTSPAQSVTLSNTGLAALAITGFTLTGANPGDFAQTTTCGASLAPGAFCTISVTFSPTGTGNRSATLNVNDNAAGSPQMVALTGTGSAQQLPAGVYVMDGFEGGNLSLWAGPNGTGAGGVEKTTVNSGTYAAALTDTSGQYVAMDQDLVGGAQALTYTRFYFNVASGTGTTVLATGTDGQHGDNLWTVIYDQSRAGLDIYLWNGARTRYDLYTNTNIVQPNTWYDVEVQFNEATAGTAQIWLNGVSVASQSGDLSATYAYSRLYLNNQATGTVYYDDVKVSNAPNGPVGGSAVSFSPTSLSFASQNAGTSSAAQSVTLTNTGTAAMTISGIALTGANPGDFAQATTCGATLAANGTCTISVTFTPTASGSRTASIQATDSGFASPQSFAVSGTGVAPGVQLNPASLTFSSQQTGTSSAAQSVTLTNTGSASLTISGISVTGTNAGDFAQANTCGASLAAGATCTIAVTFTPTAGGTRSAGVSIADSVPGSPQTVPLSGTGVVPPPPAGTYLVDGFESGNLSSWSGPNGPGQVAAETATVHTGTYAAAITCASGQYASLSQSLANSPGAITYTRFYVYISSGTGTTPIAAGTDVNGNNMWVILYDQGRAGLDTYVWNGARTRYDLYSNTNVLQPNTWYEVEIEMNEVTAGHAEIWLNGTSLAAVNGDLSATNTYTKLSLQNQTTGTIDFDDVKVSNQPNGA